jgi:hypothetical protein
MAPSKPKHPSTREESPRHQNNVAMNAWVLNNPLAQFYRNEKKTIAKARRHVNLDWDKL